MRSIGKSYLRTLFRKVTCVNLSKNHLRARDMKSLTQKSHLHYVRQNHLRKYDKGYKKITFAKCVLPQLYYPIEASLFATILRGTYIINYLSQLRVLHKCRVVVLVQLPLCSPFLLLTFRFIFFFPLILHYFRCSSPSALIIYFTEYAKLISSNNKIRTLSNDKLGILAF